MKAFHFSKDTQDFLRLLSIYRVKYVIVGGEAVIYYGYARLTGDIDIFYELTPGNAQGLFSALKKFWKGDIPGVDSQKDFLIEGNIIQFGAPPNRIDLINTITGVSFQEAWKTKEKEKILIRGQTCTVYFIGLDQLIKNKKLIKRFKDLDDLEYLRQAAKKKKK